MQIFIYAFRLMCIGNQKIHQKDYSFGWFIKNNSFAIKANCFGWQPSEVHILSSGDWAIQQWCMYGPLCCRSESRCKRSRTCERGCRRRGMIVRTTTTKCLTCRSSWGMLSSSTASARHRRWVDSRQCISFITRQSPHWGTADAEN